MSNVFSTICQCSVKCLSPPALNFTILSFCVSAVSISSSCTSPQCLCSPSFHAALCQSAKWPSFRHCFPWHQATRYRMPGPSLCCLCPMVCFSGSVSRTLLSSCVLIVLVEKFIDLAASSLLETDFCFTLFMNSDLAFSFDVSILAHPRRVLKLFLIVVALPHP